MFQLVTTTHLQELITTQSKVYFLTSSKFAFKIFVAVGVFSTWMAFRGNTRDLGSFREETDEITDLHQILEEVLLTEHRDGVACIKRYHRDPSIDDVRDLVTASGRRVRGLKVFIENFTYECNFMILEDTTSIIDHHLGEVVFGKPFARKTGLVYDQEDGTVTFEKDNEKITFKMPHKMEAFNHIDFKDVNTDFIPPFVLENNNDRGKTYYLDSLTLGPVYREDKSISKEIRHLMKLEREAKRHKGEVT
ncbi:hypothetical protein Tco_0726440 [Tanacetum coccineum]|uniref:Protein kinase-like domain, concanavalin A-like lectin/glucanase domain protein n=1 Tax=Tanacetum coccineum TaxID=301880 RepID=A0ABQ4YFK6_9ASTR